MSSAVAVYNIVTFPGLVLNKAVQEYYVRKYNVPSKGPDIEEITTKIEEEKEKKGREDAFGEDTADTVRRMKGEEGVYVDFYDIDEYEDVFVVTSVPFFVSSGTGFFFLLVAVLLSGFGVVFSFLSFWLGAAFVAHSLPDEVAGDALWRKSRETDSRLRFVGYPLAAVSKATNRLDPRWAGLAYVIVMFLVVLTLV
ncbi:MAG: hypothetical protein U5J64_00860 [Halobacteriales archaeon]|nr:hypothetical protein [Halobacteriales archaeon]